MTPLVAMFTMVPESLVPGIIAAWTGQVDASAGSIRNGL